MRYLLDVMGLEVGITVWEECKVAIDYVRPGCLVSNNILTYEVEEVADGSSVAVVGEGRGR